jgi:hypothetical protein
MEMAMKKAGIQKPKDKDVAQSKKDWAVTKELAQKLGVKL